LLIERVDIGNCFVNNFNELFTTINPSLNAELMDLFECTISDKDNLILCATPTKAEIHASLASLGQSKAPGPDGFTALF
jgi:hypothetical protein